ncbi:transglycosylase SLT domain-containing protein [Acetobacter sp. LMG 32666]|uniref:transglycosylase SLT domain-containing protein n=1 Tax=Acetobacter sp. LMG 32666 TaxID=2959295 RepID=UPI0030C87082
MIIPPCVDQIAEYYHVQQSSIVQIIQKKHDGLIGPMGIQPGWIPILEKAGFSPEAIKTNVCTNIAAGAWILAYAVSNKTKETPKIIPTFTVPSSQTTALPGNLRTCAVDAAGQYRISVPLFLGLLATEGGHVGQIVSNKNGTYDMGPAQINSSHLVELAAKGITREQIINDGCLNIHIGAWILARELGGETPQHPKEFWQRVGNYNSHTPIHNQAYQLKVWSHVVGISHSQPHG